MPIHESRAELHATADDAGKRLDQFVVSRLEEVSRARVQQLIERKKIEVDGRAEKPSYRVQAGEVVRLLAPPTPRPLNAEPEDIPLDVVFEDDAIAVVNKPAGMTVHATVTGVSMPHTRRATHWPRMMIATCGMRPARASAWPRRPASNSGKNSSRARRIVGRIAISTR